MRVIQTLHISVQTIKSTFKFLIILVCVYVNSRTGPTSEAPSEKRIETILVWWGQTTHRITPQAHGVNSDDSMMYDANHEQT